MDYQQLDKLIKQIADRIATCDDAALLEKLISTHTMLRSRRGDTLRPAIPTASPATTPQDAAPPPRTPQETRELPERVKVDPTIARAFLGRDPHNPKRTLVRVGASYYRFRADDTRGSGKIAKSMAYDILVNDCGMTRRNVRGILRQGNGLAWRVTDDHVYLFSPARVSIALDAGSLKGRPVYVPVSDLCGGIQKVRAAFYATYHGGRRAAMPMTRKTIRELTGVPERTQVIYDHVAGVKVSYNIGTENEEPTQENYQRRAWKHGRAVFKLFDLKQHKTVIAWRRPNSYDAAYLQAPRGRQRKHNRKINLVIERQPGNDSDIVQTNFPTAEIAARHASRNPGHDHYYPTGRTMTFAASKPAKLKGVNVWELLQS